jgi:hypothetical protein
VTKQDNRLKLLTLLLCSILLFTFIFIVSSQEPQSTLLLATDEKSNGIWTQAGTYATSEKYTLIKSMNFSLVYLQTGLWNQDGSIDLIPTSNQIKTAVENAHAVGLKIYSWINSGESSIIDISTSGKRSTAINSLTNLVNTYGFDGVADDIENMTSWSLTDLVTYFNSATTSLNRIGKEYFTALITHWGVEMQTPLFATIKVDRLQPMLYGYSSEHAESIFKQHIDYFLRYSASPVGLALHTDSVYGTLAEAMNWVDEQLAIGTPTTKHEGIDIFWLYGLL